MEQHSLLFNAFVYLLAAVLAVPLSKRLGFGAVLGYLIAGVAIGPWGFRVIEKPEDILHFAEFGVALLLFVIGLELNPARLWAMRKPILGLGGMQVLATTVMLAAGGIALGVPWSVALVAGMGLSLSSTAMALQLLTEKNLLPTPAGRSGFSILLFQDVAVIPMLAVIPLLGAETGGVAQRGADWMGLAKAIAVIALIVVGGRYALRPVFRAIAATGLQEIFTAFSLLLVIGTALLMQAVDMSMALGTFLAGVLLAETEYRHALETDIEPFKGLLLGLFFIAVGMSVDFGLLLTQPELILALVVALVLTKMVVLFVLARVFELPLSQQALFAFILSQGGEFAFVLFGVASQSGVLPIAISDTLIVTVALSMLTTPLLILLNEKLIAPRFSQQPTTPMDVIEDEGNPVIIAGFGRFGQIVGRVLHANGIGTTVLDHDPQHIEMLRRFGFKVFYGDACRLDLLRAAGAAKSKLLIIAVDDRQHTLELVDIARQYFPNLYVLTRAWDLVHAFELLEKGVVNYERETFEGALRLSEEALQRLGFGAWRAKQAAHRFRAHDEETCQELYRHFQGDIDVRARISSNARERFRQVMQADEAYRQRRGDSEWQ